MFLSKVKMIKIIPSGSKKIIYSNFQTDKIETFCFLSQDELLTFSSKEKIRSSHLEVFLGKVVPKIYIKFTGEHPCYSAISITLQCNFIEIALWYGCSPVNLMHIFRTPFLKNTSGGLLLKDYPINQRLIQMMN